jgi:hypothetical protein
VAAALLLAGCSSESGSDNNVGTDAGQGGRDVGTIDGSESEVGEDGAADVVPDTVDAVDGETSDVAPDAAPDVAPDAQADSGPLDGGTDTTDAGLDAATGLPIGDPCDESSECEDRLCVDTTGGVEPGICTRPCDTTDECPDDYECYQLSLDGVAVLGICLPNIYCSDSDGDGYGKGPGCIAEDCDETSELVNPGASETCDNLDNNCNGDIDEEITGLSGTCSTGLAGLCGQGSEVCTDGAVECVPSFTASAETCDGLDNNCNGEADDGLTCEELPECERIYGAYRCNTAGTFLLPIPAGVESIIALAWGGGGAGGNQGNGTGGGGGHVSAGGLESTGESLRVIVGDGGRTVGGGGGASYVYRNGTLLAVAGGGGGGASDGCSGCYGGGAGGAGGGAIGVEGQAPILPGGYGPYGFASGGGGGTQSAGGAGGVTASSTGGTTCLSDGQPGLANAGGQGGGGGPDCTRGGGGGTSETAGSAGWGNGSAGGGGAGYFGGGGGGGRDTYFGAGGGGGSSWVHPSLFTGVAELVAGVGRTPGDAADQVFYLGTNAVGGVSGPASDPNTNGQPGVVVILMFPPPWL